MPRSVLPLLAVLLVPMLCVHQAFGQGCCTAGSSTLGGFESGVQPVKTLAVSANYQFNSLTGAHQGTAKVDDPLMRTAEVAYFTIQAEYGLLRSLSFLASLYYSDKTRELTVETGQGAGQFPETAKFRGQGVGDLTLMTKYEAVAASIASPFGLTLGGGVSLPTGSYTKEVDGTRLSIDLQPGTGAVVLMAWGHFLYGIPEIGLTFFATGMYRYASPNLDGYRIGDEIITGIGGEKSLGDFFSVSMVIRSRYAMKDYAGGRFLVGTGGTYHDLMPGIGYSDGPSFVRVFSQLPLYRNVRGIQLTSSYLIGVEYRYTIGFDRLQAL